MGILKFSFFGIRHTKGNLVRRQWIDVSLMSWACQVSTSTSEIETSDSNVKQKVLKDEKR